MPLLGGVRGWTGSGLTCWAEWGEPQLVSWLGACTWSLAEGIILKLLLHKHNPYQSGLVAQESVTLIPLAEGSEGRACRSTQCTHALTLVFFTPKMNERQTPSHLEGLLPAHSVLCTAHCSTAGDSQHIKAHGVPLKPAVHRSAPLAPRPRTGWLGIRTEGWLEGEGQQPRGVKQKAGVGWGRE